MKLTKRICTTAAALITLTSGLAMANDDFLSALALERAQFSPQQAIEKINTNFTGNIVEFELDDHKGKTVYEFEVIDFAQEQINKLKISSDDGTIVKNESKSMTILGVNRLDEEDRQALTALNNSEFDLNASILELSEKYDSQVIEFELENEKGITFYKFKLIGDTGITKVIVDVETGKAIPVMKHD